MVFVVVDEIPTEYASLVFCQTPDMIITPTMTAETMAFSATENSPDNKEKSKNPRSKNVVLIAP